jgi:inhibitor of cysteine peptidase
MRRLVVVSILGVIVVALLGAGCGGAVKTYTTGDSDITTSVGGQFTIELESNKTTGYQWGLAEPFDKAVIKKVISTYQVSNKNKDLVGAGGVEKWTFEGVGKGSTTIAMSYSRPFEKNTPPAKLASFKVTVK